ncbi:MAG: HAD family phosphatase [Lachnospiraceae bacterium]|nr:HAD family phosphatase [Lachnospiraceae bacterium]
MLTNTKAVIFDLDGTLVDSMWMWREIDREYLGRFQIPLPEGLQSCIEGMSFSETAMYFKERFQIPDSLEKIQSDWNQMAWEKYEKEVPLKSGVQEFLDLLKEKQIKMAIATSNSRELVEMVLKVHGIFDYFSFIVTGYDVKKGKPDPECYLKAAGAIEVLPENCLVFEDIIFGIMAGKNAGMRVCAVEDAYSASQQEKKRELADYYISNYEEILNR